MGLQDEVIIISGINNFFWELQTLTTKVIIQYNYVRIWSKKIQYIAIYIYIYIIELREHIQWNTNAGYAVWQKSTYRCWKIRTIDGWINRL